MDKVTKGLYRWRKDLLDDVSELKKGLSGGRPWAQDFSGDIDSDDVSYAIFLGVLSLVPACVIALTSTAPKLEMLAQLFSAPLQFVITGFLCSVLIFLGSHVNRVPVSYAAAFKLALRILAVYPALAVLSYFRFGGVLELLVFGFFVIRGVLRTHQISKTNALLFFGTAYAVFALLQLQNAISPPLRQPPPNLPNLLESRH